MSPKTILLFSVAYMGCVILLHIFGKVTSIKNASKATVMPDADTGAGDLWEEWQHNNSNINYKQRHPKIVGLDINFNYAIKNNKS